MSKRPDENGIVVDESEISQTLDFNKLTGVDVSSDKVLMRAMAQAIIDYHKTRADNNKGLDGQALKSPYSKAYRTSLDFAAAGKSASDVNMQLSGDMLGSLDILYESGSKIKIGVSDESVLPRAYGHQSGFKGHPNESAMRQYKREWFGVTEKEAKEIILKEFGSELRPFRDTRPQARAQDQMISVARSLRAFIEDLNDE